MTELTIQISWQWALGIIGVLLTLVWKVSARFTAVETSVRWMERAVHDMQLAMDRLLNGKGG